MADMKNCAACGGKVRLGAFRISVNRKRGVSHYIDHMQPTNCKATEGFTCAALKPYKKPAEYEKLIERWNEAQNRAGRPPVTLRN